MTTFGIAFHESYLSAGKCIELLAKSSHWKIKEKFHNLYNVYKLGDAWHASVRNEYLCNRSRNRHFEHKIGLCIYACLGLFPGVKWHDVSCNHEKPIVCEDEPGHLNFVLGKKWLFIPLTIRIPILSLERISYIQRRPTALLRSCGYGSVCCWFSRIRIFCRDSDPFIIKRKK